jgi:hypothetical protein
MSELTLTVSEIANLNVNQRGLNGMTTKVRSQQKTLALANRAGCSCPVHQSQRRTISKTAFCATLLAADLLSSTATARD